VRKVVEFLKFRVKVAATNTLFSHKAYLAISPLSTNSSINQTLGHCFNTLRFVKK